MSVLEAFDLSIRFGGVQANLDVSIAVDEYEIVGVIGPNGAGKTTLFNMITGFYRPDSGRIVYRGRDITHLPVHERAALGLGRTFQNVGLVKGATVRENLVTAQYLQAGYSAVGGMLGHAGLDGQRADAGRAGRSAWPRRSGWPTSSTSRSPGCPTARSSGSRSPPRWPPIPTCCCSTSRRRAWGPRRRTSWATTSSTCAGASGSRS